jgi:molecular chaperone GrpE
MKNNKREDNLSMDFDEADNLARNEDNTALENESDDTEAGFKVIEKLKDENACLKNDYLRACADLENTKKRHSQEMDKNFKYAIASFAKDLLMVADNLHRALEAGDGDEVQCAALRKGVELTESELMKVFAKFGITQMDIMGKVFDPCFHRVVQEAEDPSKPAGTVIAELQTGYMINDRILREAMVIVTK